MKASATGPPPTSPDRATIANKFMRQSWWRFSTSTIATQDTTESRKWTTTSKKPEDLENLSKDETRDAIKNEDLDEAFGVQVKRLSELPSVQKERKANEDLIQKRKRQAERKKYYYAGGIIAVVVLVLVVIVAVVAGGGNGNADNDDRLKITSLEEAQQFCEALIADDDLDFNMGVCQSDGSALECFKGNNANIGTASCTAIATFFCGCDVGVAVEIDGQSDLCLRPGETFDCAGKEISQEILEQLASTF